MSVARCPLVAGQEAVANITTKDLYDRIDFKDEDGGVWKQGWDITYNGSEWDDVPLKVFVVPHSHNDPGWLKTVTEYYETQSIFIINNIVDSLLKNPSRKFIWEEMSYLQLWWNDASPIQRENLARLVHNGQLEIVGGGWVMNDEANSHYFAIIDQLLEGNRWLYDTLGVVPQNAWAIDPFGHSPTMAYLYRRMGFENMLIQRTHYEVKKALAMDRSLEFYWRQSWDPRASTDILCHMMPFYSYDIPHTCGPDPSICCQFDFARMHRSSRYSGCPWGDQPQAVTPRNEGERAEKLLDQWRKKAVLYRSNVVLVPLGDDFRYGQNGEAELQFSNFERIFEYINGHPELRATAQFGTLKDYFTAVKSRSRPSQFPTLSGDFFTYSDVRKDYWSGYYTTRPYYKSLDRVLESNLRATEILVTFAHAHNRALIDRKNYDLARLAFPYRCAKELTMARRNLALFQHHDGVTGTARAYVAEDYARRLHTSIIALQSIMKDAISLLLYPKFLEGRSGRGVQLSFFQTEERRTGEHVLPIRRVMYPPKNGTFRRVVVYNPLEERVRQAVSIIVHSIDSLSVMDSRGHCVQSQTLPDWQFFRHGQSSTRHRLFWQASIPALGVETFIISHSHCPAPVASHVTLYNVPKTFSCPQGYQCHIIDPSSSPVQYIQNKRIKLGFSSATGLLISWKAANEDSTAGVEEEVAAYWTRRSGAYLFHPEGDAQPCVLEGGVTLVSRGPIVEEFHSQFRFDMRFSPLVRVARLYAGDSVQSAMVEMLHRIHMTVSAADNLELVLRYKTNLESWSENSSSVFFSDLNGFQMARREHYDKVPLQGNFYPMPTLAFLQCRTGRRFSVHTRQPVGVASLQSGWLEMMLDRRLTVDDSRGLGEGIRDNHRTETTFFLSLESNLTKIQNVDSTAVLFPSLLSHRIGAQLNYPLHIFLGREERNPVGSRLSSGEPKPWLPSGFLMTFEPLSGHVPCDFHIVNLKLPRVFNLEGSNQSRPLANLIIQRRAWDDAFGRPGRREGPTCGMSAGGWFKMRKIFGKYFVSNVSNETLRLLPQNGEPEAQKMGGGVVWSNAFHVDPMEIQAISFDLSVRSKGYLDGMFV